MKRKIGYEKADNWSGSRTLATLVKDDGYGAAGGCAR
jgi:hypothetical protein